MDGTEGGYLTLTHKGKVCQCKIWTKLLSGKKVLKTDTGWKKEFSFLVWSPPNLRQNSLILISAVKTFSAYFVFSSEFNRCWIRLA